jgi:hypothetical protein
VAGTSVGLAATGGLTTLETESKAPLNLSWLVVATDRFDCKAAFRVSGMSVLNSIGCCGA